MEKIWILVADSAHARILATTARTAVPTEVTRLEHPESRLKESELVADQPGRSRESLAQGHAMSEASATVQEEAAFAGELGVIRQKLNGPLEKSVIQSVSKNLVNESESVIHQNIFN